MDEEDEEPFSATNSAVVAQGPKQDEPKRPQPGGRFPSQLSIDTLSQRGLQAPLSPSSGSSGFGDAQVVAAASSLPGSGVGNHYGADPSSPTHAALVNKQAREDGINPYTSQPINHVQNQTSNVQTFDGLAAAGLGAVAGVAGSEAYRHHEDEKTATEYRQDQEQQAALESSTIAAPDTFEQESEQQAAHEAAKVASPDIPFTSVAADSNLMSGGRSQGDVSIVSPQLNKDAQDNNRSTPVVNRIETVLKPLTEDARPSLAAGQNHQSVQSISQLHVPGEFPRPNTDSGDALSVLPA